LLFFHLSGSFLSSTSTFLGLQPPKSVITSFCFRLRNQKFWIIWIPMNDYVLARDAKFYLYPLGVCFFFFSGCTWELNLPNTEQQTGEKNMNLFNTSFMWHGSQESGNSKDTELNTYVGLDKDLEIMQI
jgi:hypothetical protein